MSTLPHHITSEGQLDEVLITPRATLCDFMRHVQSPLIVLGAGGKMGPSLAALAKRAADEAGHPLEVIAVSRFSSAAARQWLEQHHVRTIAVDLLDPTAWSALPDSANIIHLVGLKFGTEQNPALTWATNTLPPSAACRRYPHARIVALSSGTIYPLMPVTSGGATEETPLNPAGEYANACLARERIFQHHSQQTRTPIALIRLNYAIDLRYGVLHDIAQKIAQHEPIDLAMGHLNCIWQSDANEFILRSLALCDSPPALWNLTSQEIWPVRDLALKLGGLMNIAPVFVGNENPTALLSNPSRLLAKLGAPPTSLETMLRWTAHWVQRGGTSLGKPTHFEVRDGKY